MFYFNADLVERMAIARDDRLVLEDRIVALLALQTKARGDGLLSLDEDIEDIREPFFKTALRLVIDGTDSSIVEGILAAMILAEAPRGAKLIAMIIDAEAALSLQAGESPHGMFRRLGAWLGPESIVRLESTLRELEV